MRLVDNEIKLKQYLLQKADEYRQPSFFDEDPIVVPKLCRSPKDAEVMAFLVALMAWGKRELIVKAGKRLLELFDHAPYEFVRYANSNELKRCVNFVYRTLNGQDVLEIVLFLRSLYEQDEQGLARAFNPILKPDESQHAFFYIDHFLKIADALLVHPHARNHFPLNNKSSPAKRLNLFLRWMVRKDDRGIDLGLWHNVISQKSLVIPLDVHVVRTLRQLQLTPNNSPSRRMALHITALAKKWSPDDPCFLDFAFFGLSYFHQKSRFKRP